MSVYILSNVYTSFSQNKIHPSPKTKYTEYHEAFIMSQYSSYPQILQLTTCINWAVQL
jgi:hypothetical protein